MYLSSRQYIIVRCRSCLKVGFIPKKTDKYNIDIYATMRNQNTILFFHHCDTRFDEDDAIIGDIIGFSKNRVGNFQGILPGFTDVLEDNNE